MVTNISKEINTSIFGGISVPKIGVTYPNNGNSRLFINIVIIYHTTERRNPKENLQIFTAMKTSKLLLICVSYVNSEISLWSNKWLSN
jgi:hypothetical protein